jgi:hypothetical protein
MSESTKLFKRIPEIQKVIKAIFENSGVHPPIFFTSDGGDHIKTEQVFFASNDDKDEVMEHMRRRIQDGTVKEYLFIAESWILESTDVNALKKYGSVAEHPARKEIMLMQYSSAKEEILYKAYITRGRDSKPVLGEWDDFCMKEAKKDETGRTGRFNDMFGRAMSEFN